MASTVEKLKQNPLPGGDLDSEDALAPKPEVRVQSIIICYHSHHHFWAAIPLFCFVLLINLLVK